MKSYGLSKPHPSEVVSGDAWAILERQDGSVRVVLVDGAGHGPLAAEVAQAAIESLHGTVEQPIEAALGICHTALRGGRGAAVSIADVSGAGMTFAGIGNVEARVLSPLHQQRFTPQRGVAGFVAPQIRPLSVELDPAAWALIMHSDGVSARLEATWAALSNASPEHFIAAALERWGRLTDDATMVLLLGP